MMYVCEGLEFKDCQFPADKIIEARENRTLGRLLPSGTEFPVRFSNGERNVLVVCRDRDHTYLVTKYLMAEPFAMNRDWTNKGGWPACRMRGHINETYDMLPEGLQRVVIPLHAIQCVNWGPVECIDLAFLLSAVNIFGEDAWSPSVDCSDSQIDIFQDPANRIKKRPGASAASPWWTRSAYDHYGFFSVNADGKYDIDGAGIERGVVIGFCIEDREARR